MYKRLHVSLFFFSFYRHACDSCCINGTNTNPKLHLIVFFSAAKEGLLSCILASGESEYIRKPLWTNPDSFVTHFNPSAPLLNGNRKRGASSYYTPARSDHFLCAEFWRDIKRLLTILKKKAKKKSCLKLSPLFFFLFWGGNEKKK